MRVCVGPCIQKASLFGSGKQPLVCRGQPASQAPEAPTTPGLAGEEGSSGGGDAERPSGSGAADVGAGAGGAAQRRWGWYRDGTNVAYYPSPYRGRTATSAEAQRKGKKSAQSSKKGKASMSAAAASGAPPDKGGSSAAARAGDSAGGGGGNGGQASSALQLAEVGPGLHCATFTLTFDAPGTWHYLASCYPYGYSDLQV